MRDNKVLSLDTRIFFTTLKTVKNIVITFFVMKTRLIFHVKRLAHIKAV